MKRLIILQRFMKFLKLYGLEKNIVMDLGLINHMGYYSDVIFQGFVEKFGKPVLMGGRYDQLGNEFGAKLPAIGFACEIESLVKASTEQADVVRNSNRCQNTYDQASLEQSITIANELRERNYSVLSYPQRERTSECSKKVFIKLKLNEAKDVSSIKMRTQLFFNVMNC